MARSLNLIIVEGNLGSDPELRYTPSGTAVAQMSVATSRPYKDSNDEWTEETTWFRVVAWAQTGERIADKARKGDFVRVTGRVRTREYDVPGCPKGKHYAFEVIADRIDHLGRFERSSDGTGGGRAAVDSYVDEMAARRAPTAATPAGAAAPSAAPAAAPAAPSSRDYSTLDDLPF